MKFSDWLVVRNEGMNYETPQATAEMISTALDPYIDRLRAMGEAYHENSLNMAKRELSEIAKDFMRRKSIDAKWLKGTVNFIKEIESRIRNSAATPNIDRDKKEKLMEQANGLGNIAEKLLFLIKDTAMGTRTPTH